MNRFSREILLSVTSFILAAIAPAYAAPPIGVRDIVLGMKGSELIGKLASSGPYTCSALTCRQTLQIKGVPVDAEFLLSSESMKASEGWLWEIRLSFDEHRFPVLRDGLVEKYGSSSRSAKVTFRLRDGKTKIRETLLWNLGKGEISITNIAAEGGEGKGLITMTGGKPAGGTGF